MLACAFSVKFVGLFVILLVGANTGEQLWVILGDLSRDQYCKTFLLYLID